MLNRILNALKYKSTRQNQQNQEPNIGQISIANAQSWAPDIHPNGPEDSSLVKSIEYSNGDLDVEYRDGFKAKYNATPQEAQDFSRADSKGRWALKNLWNRSYTAI